MAKKNEADFDDPVRSVGTDSTATFDESESNPTERASSQALNDATAAEGENEQDELDGEEALAADSVHADAIDTGVDDADTESDDELAEDEEDEEEEYDEDEDDLEGIAEDEEGLPVIPRNV